LLVEGLGWNHYRAEAVRVHLDGHDHVLEPVAEKAGFVVYVCGPGADGSVPAYPVRRKIENQIAKLAYEHLIIFVDAGQTLQVWQWVKREAGKPAACREQTYYAGQSGEALLQRLQPLFVSLDEEPEGKSFSLAETLPDPAEPTDELAHWLFIQLVVREAMEKLPENQRQALILYAEEQMSYAEIAVATNTNPGTVRSRLSHTRRTLRRLVPPWVLAALDGEPTARAREVI